MPERAVPAPKRVAQARRESSTASSKLGEKHVRRNASAGHVLANGCLHLGTKFRVRIEVIDDFKLDFSPLREVGGCVEDETPTRNAGTQR